MTRVTEHTLIKPNKYGAINHTALSAKAKRLKPDL